MGFIVRLFFLIVLASVALSVFLGWFALAKARVQFNRSFGIKVKEQNHPDYGPQVIEGEYKVLGEEDKRG